MKILFKGLSIMLACFLAVACQLSFVEADITPASPFEVCFTTGAASTRSQVADDGCTVSWMEGDKASLWARGANGAWQLSSVPFSVFAIDGGRAWFSATLDAPMPEGTYTYYATYPEPTYHDGTAVRFDLPSVQNGAASSGADIMVASASAGKELSGVPEPEDHSTLSMTFSHLVHLLRLYLPKGADKFGGEPVQRIVLTMPRDVVGTISTDISDPSSATLSDGSSVVTLELDEPIHESASKRDYALACIFPTRFQAGDEMVAKLYSETKVGTTAPINMEARDMKAGHATSVALVPQAVSTFCRIYFHIDSNHLGEDVQTMTLTAPEGCKWSDNGSNVYVYHKDRGFGAGERISLEFEQESAYRSLSGKNITVTYDSEHAVISEDLVMPDMSAGYNTAISLNVPYLLYEDFSSLASFSSNDNYATSSAGSKSATSFLDGWTGGRVGGSAGQCVRLACRRETSADYDARMDSAPLKGTLKSPVNLSVTFDYGADNRFGGLAIITDGNVGQNCYMGYVTDSKAYASNATDGTFEDGNAFYVKEYTGSYGNTPNDYSFIIHSAPAGSLLRITWRTKIEHQVGTTNTTAWLYVDNVRVSISSE